MPAAEGKRKKPPTIEQVLGPGGRLAESGRLESYQFRQEQADAAGAIEEALRCGMHCLVEAGTGVGKTLAYLLPAVRAAARGKKTVISTHTLSLQAQLLEKDIPLVCALFPEVNIKAVAMKGRGNYLCRQDLDAADADLFHSTDALFRDIQRWARNTDTGDVAELGFNYPQWYELAANPDTCRQKECRYYERCFYYRMRWGAADANLIVVNHALYLSDLALRSADPQNGIIPEHDHVVFDEAHHLEDVATRVFGLEVTNRRIPHLAERIRRLKGVDLTPERLTELEQLSEALFTPFQEARQEFFLDEVLDPEAKGRSEEQARAICERLGLVAAELARAADAQDAPLRDRLQGLGRAAARLGEEIQTLVFRQEEGYIRWGQHVRPPEGTGRARRAEPRTSLYWTPVEVGPLLREMLWDNVESAVLTSATLANSGGFSYVRARLGMPDRVVEKIVGSPFEFRTRALLYVPGELPEPPKSPSAGYTERAAAEIERVIGLTEGRAFVLFTSRRMMNEVYDLLAARLPYAVFRQGDMPPARLLEAFRESGNGCLFGTQTFWEGVDVQGSALSAVIIDRLPFAAPDSPVTRARTEAITAAGGDWFRDYSIPQAQIRLKQGFGRLIRTHSDRGIVCVLDTRLMTRGYGKDFVRYLPPASRASLWSRVERFWREDDPAAGPRDSAPGSEETP